MLQDKGIVSESFIEELLREPDSRFPATPKNAVMGGQSEWGKRRMLEAEIEDRDLVCAKPVNAKPGYQTKKRVVLPEIWTLVALEILEHGDVGAYKGVSFTIQLTEVHHLERPLVVDTLEAGFTSEDVKRLEEAHLLYPYSAGGFDNRFMQTSASNLAMAVDWKLRGRVRPPEKGPSKAYNSRHFVFHTLKVSVL